LENPSPKVWDMRYRHSKLKLKYFCSADFLYNLIESINHG